MPREFAFGSAYTSSFGEPNFAKNVTLSNTTNATTDSISYFTVPYPEFAPLMRSRSKSLPILRGTQTDYYEADTPINKVYLQSNFKPILKPIPAPVQLLPKKTPNFLASSADKNVPKYANIELVTPSPKVVAPAATHLPLDQYRINVDPNPIVVRKKPAEKVQYTQQISVKFLKPPPLQQPGDIIIRQEPDVQAPPVSPLLLRQKPPRPPTPSTLIVREKPPAPPPRYPPKLIVIPGKVIPPPPRKVIVERLPVIPPPPQNIMVERWLGYDEQVRRVVFQPAPKLIPAPAPKNILIEWDSPEVVVDKQIKYLGVTQANPEDYIAKHGASLVDSSKLPLLVVNHFKAPQGERFAADSVPKPPKLVGDLHALNLVNSTRGLKSYKHILQNKNFINQRLPVSHLLPTYYDTYGSSSVRL